MNRILGRKNRQRREFNYSFAGLVLRERRRVGYLVVVRVAVFGEVG